MIIAQVLLRLATIKHYFKKCSLTVLRGSGGGGGGGYENQSVSGVTTFANSCFFLHIWLSLSFAHPKYVQCEHINREHQCKSPYGLFKIREQISKL